MILLSLSTSYILFFLLILLINRYFLSFIYRCVIRETVFRKSGVIYSKIKAISVIKLFSKSYKPLKNAYGRWGCVRDNPHILATLVVTIAVSSRRANRPLTVLYFFSSIYSPFFELVQFLLFYNAVFLCDFQLILSFDPTTISHISHIRLLLHHARDLLGFAHAETGL